MFYPQMDMRTFSFQKVFLAKEAYEPGVVNLGEAFKEATRSVRPARKRPGVGGENRETRLARSRAGLLQSTRDFHLVFVTFGALQSLRNSDQLFALLGTAIPCRSYS